MDWFPTILNLAGVELPTDRKIDGVDMHDVLFEQGPFPRTKRKEFLCVFIVACVNSCARSFRQRNKHVYTYMALRVAEERVAPLSAGAPAFASSSHVMLPLCSFTLLIRIDMQT